MQSLFPTQLPGRGRASEKPLVSFKAGKCELEPIAGGKFRVSADLRKGQVSFVKSPDGLRHFKWGDRSGSAVDDLIIFPDEASFKRVRTGREGDRVFVLKFNTGDRKFLFWMQDKLTADKDDEICAKVNQCLNNPAADVVEEPAAAGGQMSPEAWMQMLGLAPPAAPTAPVTAPAAAPIGAAPSTFSNLDLSSLLAGSPASANQAPSATDVQRAILAASMERGATGPPVSLAHVLTPEAILGSGILDDPAVAHELAQQLPEGQQAEHFLEENIRSPQLRQALGTLTDVLQSDNYNSVLANLGVNPEPGAAQLAQGDPVGAFLTSVQAANPPVAAPASTSEPMDTTEESVPTNREANAEEKDH